MIDVWYDRLSDSQTLIKILVSTEESEPLIDLFDQHFSLETGFRLILLPVVTTVPRVEEPEETPSEKGKEQPQPEEKSPARVNR